MAELITTKQVQDLLQVDRITIYRMLKDGRLSGVKVGNQWRFKSHEIDKLMSLGTKPRQQLTPAEALPVHCIQVIQEVFAEILNVGSVTTDVEGEPISEISNSCDFCNLILSTPTGRQACVDSWKELAQTPKGDPKFFQCHAGFQYARGRIESEGQLVSILVAGQFLNAPIDDDELDVRMGMLSNDHEIDFKVLKEASTSIRILDDDKQDQIGKWLKKVADTFETITHERAELLGRLKNISEMSTIQG